MASPFTLTSTTSELIRTIDRACPPLTSLSCICSSSCTPEIARVYVAWYSAARASTSGRDTV